MKRRHFGRRGLLTALVFLAVTATAFTTGGLVGPTADTAYTQGDVVLLVAYILLALIFSFLCSIAEAVLLSITPSYIAGLLEKRPVQGAQLKRLKQEKVDQSLAAILTLNTVAHTVGAIGSGAKATIIFGNAWFGLFSAVMTLMILFLSEIIPKTLGAMFWRKLTTPTAYFIRGLIALFYPLIWVSEGLTKMIAGKKSNHEFSREEFIAMAGIGERAGKIQQQESSIIRNLFRLNSIKAEDIMTPRTVMMGFPQEISVTEALKVENPFSRLPVYQANLDQIDGFVLRDEILLAKARGQGEIKLKTLRREILTVPGNISISRLLETLLDSRQHIALVINEYGGTKGLVTLEDVVETLLGKEIVDEMDRVEDLQALARQQWVKRAKALGLDVDPSHHREKDPI